MLNWHQHGPDFLYLLTHEDNPKKAVNRISVHVQAGKDEDGQRVSQADALHVTALILSTLRTAPVYTLKIYFKGDPQPYEATFWTREAAALEHAKYPPEGTESWYLIDPDGIILDSN